MQCIVKEFTFTRQLVVLSLGSAFIACFNRGLGGKQLDFPPARQVAKRAERRLPGMSVGRKGTVPSA